MRRERVIENRIYSFLANTYAVGTQKNRLNETVLLSSQTTQSNVKTVEKKLR